MATDRRIERLLTDGYQQELIDSVLDFSYEDVQDATVFLIRKLKHQNSNDELLNFVSNQNKGPSPSQDGISHVYFVGGQPGAGKSSAMKKINEREKNRNGAVNIEMDAYREMHPHIKEIKEMIDQHYQDERFSNLAKEEIELRKSDDLVALTQKFADKVAHSYKVNLFSDGYNIAIESTLRHSQSVFEWANRFKEINPQCVISVIMVGVSKEVAFAGTKERAEQIVICSDRMVQEAKNKNISLSSVTRGLIGQELYDKICDDLPVSIDEISDFEKTTLINGNVEIIDRDGNVNYDRNEEMKKDTPKKASDVELSSLTGEIAKQQESSFHQQQENLVSENKQHYFGVDTYVNEHREDVVRVFGSEEKAKEVFISDVKQSYIAAKKDLDDQSPLQEAVVRSISIIHSEEVNESDRSI